MAFSSPRPIRPFPQSEHNKGIIEESPQALSRTARPRVAARVAKSLSPRCHKASASGARPARSEVVKHRKIKRSFRIQILASHYQPAPNDGGPSWLTFLGHVKDSLW